MNFRKGQRREDPEINLIPFIDVLLAVLIFLMLTTTYSRLTELKISLPSANAQSASARPKELQVLVSADGRYVAFESGASNLIADDINGPASDIFVYDTRPQIGPEIQVLNGTTNIAEGIDRTGADIAEHHPDRP